MRGPIGFQSQIVSGTAQAGRVVRHFLSRAVSTLTVASFLATSSPMVFAPAAHAEEMKRVALVIGNAGYTGDITPLANPANDANDVADSLQQIGFDVTRVIDADGDAFRRALRTFAGKARQIKKRTTKKE